MSHKVIAIRLSIRNPREKNGVQSGPPSQSRNDLSIES